MFVTKRQKMKKYITILGAALLMAFTLNGQSIKKQVTFSSNELQAYEPARIYKAMDKGRQGKPIKIGVIGGSITAGTAASTESKRWANLMTDWWETTFPSSSVTLINAGWGGTGSDIGVHRVYDDLLKQNPDFVVIEFSVNDSEGPLAKKMMEGLVQQIILADSTPGIMMLILKMENGTTAQASHKAVADYYQIPMVSFADLIDAQVTADGITLNSIFVDGLHPNDVGMAYIANFIKLQLDSLYATLPASSELPEIIKTLPVPLVTDTYSHTFQFFYNNIIPSMNQGWAVTSTGWSTDVVGNQIDFSVTGNAVSLVYTQNIAATRGKAEVWVDDGPKTIINSYMNEDWGTRSSFALVQEGLTDGPHTLHIRTIEETTTGGHYVHIARVLVAGNVGSAPPIAITSPYQKAVVGKPVTFDGTGSFDPDGDEISSYLWTVESKPPTSMAMIDQATESISSFTPDMAGDFQINLVVSSGINSSVAAHKKVSVRATNAIPLAVAGSDTLSVLNKYFKFDGSKSTDADGDLLTYKWVLESAPSGSASFIMRDDYVKPQCKFDLEGDYVISLTVYDSLDYSEKDTLKVTAKAIYTIITGDLLEDKKIKLFPNPIQDKLTIQYNLEILEPVTMEIYSIVGKKVGYYIFENNQMGLNTITINTKDEIAQSGVYLVKVVCNKNTIVKKINVLR